MRKRVERSFAPELDEAHYLRPRDRWEPLQESVDRITRSKVIKQGSHGNARPAEDGRAAHHLGINRHNLS
jgi:hypothetical protein